MKEGYVNAFLTPPISVWEQKLKSQLELVGAELASPEFTTDDLTVIIGISGQLQGNVLYSFSQQTARAITSKMTGREITEYEGVVILAMCDIANAITRNAIIELSNAGAVCQVSPPIVIDPAGSKFSTVVGRQILVKFSSDLGPLHIRVSLTEDQGSV